VTCTTDGFNSTWEVTEDLENLKDRLTGVFKLIEKENTLKTGRELQ
jgi:hypothetical protein